MISNRAHRKKILIIDDLTINIKILSEALKPEYETLFAKSGSEGLRMAWSKKVPDLIILDIMMPKMDGFEVLKRLKADKRSRHIPIIFVTASITEKDEKLGLEMGAVDYIARPFSPLIVRARVRTHLELKKHRDDLEVMVFERTKELIRVNERLKREIAEKMLAREDREKLQAQLYHSAKLEAIGTMAGGIAHDFNNIIGAIHLNAELALDDVSDREDARYCLQQILQGSRQSKDLVKQILTFGRKSEKDMESIDIRRVVKDCLTMLRALIPSTIVIERDIPKSLGKIWACAGQIQQLLINLGINAAHAMENKTGVLRVKLEKLPAGKESPESPESIRLTVSDTGCGISPENVDRIFDPWFTTKPVGVGTGLGLSMVHGIVANHGGAIKVESRINHGATFRITFPTARDAAVEKTREPGQLPMGAAEKILLVDDEKNLVDAHKRILERLGYEVAGETDSLEALNTFRLQPKFFDLAILDMSMPHLTGVDLAREIHKIRNDLPIVICTGYSQNLSHLNTPMAGISDLLMKPFSREQIAEVVSKALCLKN